MVGLVFYAAAGSVMRRYSSSSAASNPRAAVLPRICSVSSTGCRLVSASASRSASSRARVVVLPGLAAPAVAAASAMFCRVTPSRAFEMFGCWALMTRRSFSRDRA